MFLEKNNQKEITNYLIKSIGVREELSFSLNKIILENKYEDNKESLETYDNYLLVNSSNNDNLFKKYLLEYDSDFIVIDLNNSKIETCYL